MAENILLIDDSPEQIPTDIKLKAAKAQRDGLDVLVSEEKTYLILIAIHREKDKNIINRVNTKMGIPFFGYLRDDTTDSYCIQCFDYLLLGYVPISMQFKLKNWCIRTPLSEGVIRRFLSTAQKKEIRAFQNKYPIDQFLIEFVQLIDYN